MWPSFPTIIYHFPIFILKFKKFTCLYASSKSCRGKNSPKYDFGDGSFPILSFRTSWPLRNCNSHFYNQKVKRGIFGKGPTEPVKADGY